MNGTVTEKVSAFQVKVNGILDEAKMALNAKEYESLMEFFETIVGCYMENEPGD